MDPSFRDATSVHLIRHAPTDSNRRGVFQGALDVPAIPLVDVGRLPGLGQGPRRIYTSSLSRARYTAAALFPDDVATIDARLAERTVGVWEGLDHATVRTRWPESHIDGVLNPRVTPPGGEAMTAFATRVHEFLDELRSAAHGRVYVVTHNGWIRVAQLLTGQVRAADLFAHSVPHLIPIAVGLDRLRPVGAVWPA